jgi:superfamily II DNA or RNA helicase
MTKLRMQALNQAFDRKAIRIALTATPDYNEKRSLQRFFPDLIHEIDLAEAFAMELLAPTRMWVVEVDANASTVRFVVA